MNEEARLVMRAPKELVAGPHTKHQVSQKNQNILVGTPGHRDLQITIHALTHDSTHSSDHTHWHMQAKE